MAKWPKQRKFPVSLTSRFVFCALLFLNSLFDVNFTVRRWIKMYAYVYFNWFLHLCNSPFFRSFKRTVRTHTNAFRAIRINWLERTGCNFTFSYLLYAPRTAGWLHVFVLSNRPRLFPLATNFEVSLMNIKNY